MNFTYETQENATYLVYSIAEDDVMDSVSLGMIMNNKVPGLAPVFFAQMDAQKYLRYNVSSKISVQQFFEGGVTRNKLVGVFSGIIDAMLAIEDYMIDPDTMVLDLNYIYTDVSTYETQMICLPRQNRSGQSQDMQSFFKNIVFGTKFDQSENCEYVARLLTYFNSSATFSLVEFKKLLDEIAGKAPAAPAPAVAPAAPVGIPTPAPAGIPTPAPAPAPIPPVAPMGQNMPGGRPQPAQPNMANGGMAIPQGNNVSPRPAAPGMVPPQAPMQVPQGQGKEAKKPGMFAGLLSKGNKAEAPKEKKEKEKKEKKGKNAAPVSPQGISIPGQPAFDIPGVTPSIASKKQAAAPQPQASARPAAPQPGNIPPQAPARPAVPGQAPQQAMARPVAPQPGNVPPMSAPQSAVPPMQMPHITQVQGGFGETTVLSAGGGAGETTVLSAVTAMPFLTRTKNNEKIPLNKPVFRIGKERSFVDYFISDNPAVSRSHANIISREGLYFVLDTNSTNHTYVNGQMIQSNLEIQINPGDKIRFANEEFEFRIF